jgi:protease-4
MLKKIFIRLLIILGAITAIEIILGLILGIFLWTYKEEVPDKTILELDISGELAEYVPDDTAARMMRGKTPTTLDLIESLERASQDDRVVGIVARIGHPSMGLARFQEIRDAVLNFRKNGKMSVAYTDSFGEFGPGNSSYYLATAFEEICLQPSGAVGLTGLMMEARFLKGTLDKLGLVPRMDHRYEYKNAMNIFTEDKYTEPHKEAVCKVMESMFGQIVKEIARTRDISEDNVRILTEHGVFLGQEALNAKLVDKLAYQDEVYQSLKEKFGKDVQFISLADYLDRAGGLYEEGETIALIYGVGAVQRGKSEFNPLYGDTAMGSETLTAAFRDAIEDESVKAILFRVDSPGGSYIASDSIWRETVRAKEAGKPVIVSMGDVAGSGGYFVAMAADKIIAQPGTITGSIGVFAGKMLTTGFWDKLGISWDEVHTGPNATMWTGTHDYTPEQWNILQATLDWIYADFTSKAAQGRGMPAEKILEVAKGRIWTGEDAKSLGLVDELGGFPLAIRLAKAAAGIPKDADICLKIFPKKKPFLEMLLEDSPVSSEEDAVISAALEEIQPLLRSVRTANESGVLSMPEMRTTK